MKIWVWDNLKESFLANTHIKVIDIFFVDIKDSDFYGTVFRNVFFIYLDIDNHYYANLLLHDAIEILQLDDGDDAALIEFAKLYGFSNIYHLKGLEEYESNYMA